MNGHLDENDPPATVPVGDRPDERDRGPAARSGAWRVPHRLGTPVPKWGGALLLAAVLGWISPVLLLLAALVTGIGLLLRSGADPGHWGPVPPSPSADRRSGLRRADARPAHEAAPEVGEHGPPAGSAPAPGRVSGVRRSRPRPPSRPAGRARHHHPSMP